MANYLGTKHVEVMIVSRTSDKRRAAPMLPYQQNNIETRVIAMHYNPFRASR